MQNYLKDLSGAQALNRAQANLDQAEADLAEIFGLLGVECKRCGSDPKHPNCSKKYRSSGTFKKGHKSFQGKNKKNSNWKGDKVGYHALHEWVKRNLPKVDFCASCKKKKRVELANISQEYKRDLTDWEWLCRSCHMIKDGRMKNLKQFVAEAKCTKCGEEVLGDTDGLCQQCV